MKTGHAVTCATCGEVFEVQKAYYAKRRKYCASSCQPRRGESNPNWRGGQIRRRDGRLLIYAPGNPNAVLYGGSPYVLRYRAAAAETVGRPLRADEIVHHINGDKQDDRPENLQVMTQSEHIRLHAPQPKHAQPKRNRR